MKETWLAWAKYMRKKKKTDLAYISEYFEILDMPTDTPEQLKEHYNRLAEFEAKQQMDYGRAKKVTFVPEALRFLINNMVHLGDNFVERVLADHSKRLNH